MPPLAYTIDTVAATKYRITNPQDVVVDGDGKLYVVESLVQQGRRIHKVDAAAGTISIIAGTGEDGYNGDGGPATGARLSFPIGVTVGADCRLYVADTGNPPHPPVKAPLGIGVRWMRIGLGSSEVSVAVPIVYPRYRCSLPFPVSASH